MTQTICHTINQSPFSSQLWSRCLASVDTNDCLVFINDGVYGALNNQPYSHRLKIKTCYAIDEDIKKRGLDQLALNQEVQLITYTQWVELSTKHPLSRSWY